jgi:DNA-binding transcriptional ArsR family regulator
MAKSQKFPGLNPYTDKVAKFMSVLAHKKRLLILETLLNEEMSIAALADRTDLSRTELTLQLSRLKEQKLVSIRHADTVKLYSVASPCVAPVFVALADLYCLSSERFP